jgi:NADPH:quinone reductase-like Zn-dependent oxidoreductase
MEAGSAIENKSAVSETMRAARLHTPTGPVGLSLDQVARPAPSEGEALVRVHAAALTRDELEWPTDRLPAVPSYELSGVVASVAEGVDDAAVGEAVYALIPFDRDGAAAEFVAVAARVLSPKPLSLGHLESAALPLAGLSAWQGLFEHGRLENGERVLVNGAAGGVGHLAVQLARWRGAHVIATVSAAGLDAARRLGAHELFERTAELENLLEPVDLVFDTAGGALLARAAALLRPGGRIVSVAEQAPDGVAALYFVVESNRAQLAELARLVEAGHLRPTIDSVYPLEEVRAAFERCGMRGTHGKVVLRVADE